MDLSKNEFFLQINNERRKIAIGNDHVNGDVMIKYSYHQFLGVLCIDVEIIFHSCFNPERSIRK